MKKLIALAAAAAAFMAVTVPAFGEEVDAGPANIGVMEDGYVAYLDGDAGNPSYSAGYAGIREKDSYGNSAPDGCYREDGRPNDTDGDHIADYEDADIDGDGKDDDGKDANGNDIDANGDGQADGPDSNVKRDGDPDGCASSPGL
jgi:hypothetical protein